MVKRVAAIFTEAGIGPGMSGEEVIAGLEQRYRDHPIDPALNADLELFFRGEITAIQGAAPVAAAMARVLGTGGSSFKAAPASPKEGEVRAGPLARFTVGKSRDRE
jgi:hypothetical protein